MPEYIYENPETKEQITVWQSVHEAHEYEVDGVSYDRVYTIPNASIDSRIDANSEADFTSKTKAKTYGFGTTPLRCRPAELNSTEVKIRLNRNFLKKSLIKEEAKSI